MDLRKEAKTEVSYLIDWNLNASQEVVLSPMFFGLSINLFAFFFFYVLDLRIFFC